MFIVSMKINRRKQLACILVAIFVMASVMVVLFQGDQIASVVKSGTKSSKPKNHAISNTEQVTDFLKGFGWEVDVDAVEIKQVVIPLEFNEMYQQYNAIQKNQGYDLERYRGITVQQYSFAITNYPEKPDNVRAHVLLNGGTIIGGDVSHLELNGFIHGFQAP